MAKNTETNEAQAPNEPALKTLSINGVTFQVPYKYAAGHVLTDVEAKALNQTRFENLRNNFASTVKASLEGKEGAVAQGDLPAKFAEYEAAYEFSTPGSGGGSRALDPIEREARTLAIAIVKEKLKAKGRSYTAPKEATDEQKEAYRKQIDEAVDRYAAAPEVVAQARKNVEERANSLAAISANLDL